jgi:hypothetical protein
MSRTIRRRSTPRAEGLEGRDLMSAGLSVSFNPQPDPPRRSAEAAEVSASAPTATAARPTESLAPIRL